MAARKNAVKFVLRSMQATLTRFHTSRGKAMLVFFSGSGLGDIGGAPVLALRGAAREIGRPESTADRANGQAVF
jgi:hypothetical protein